MNDGLSNEGVGLQQQEIVVRKILGRNQSSDSIKQ